MTRIEKVKCSCGKYAYPEAGMETVFRCKGCGELITYLAGE